MKKLLCVTAFFLLGCVPDSPSGGGNHTPVQKPQEGGKSCRFSEWIDDDGLQVAVWVTGETVEIGLKNGRDGKVIRWSCWRFGPIEDEHGNKFEQQPLQGAQSSGFKPVAARASTVRLPFNPNSQVPSLSSWSDYPEVVRVDPQTFRWLGIYYERLPVSSRMAKVVATTGTGKKITFQGEIKREADPGVKLDPETKHPPGLR